jgi:hypothetical protein
LCRHPKARTASCIARRSSVTSRFNVRERITIYNQLWPSSGHATESMSSALVHCSSPTWSSQPATSRPCDHRSSLFTWAHCRRPPSLVSFSLSNSSKLNPHGIGKVAYPTPTGRPDLVGQVPAMPWGRDRSILAVGQNVMKVEPGCRARLETKVDLARLHSNPFQFLSGLI